MNIWATQYDEHFPTIHTLKKTLLLIAAQNFRGRMYHYLSNYLPLWRIYDVSYSSLLILKMDEN